MICEIRDESLYLPGADLWIDSTKPRDLGFISHAHSDHTAGHTKIVCTRETAALLDVWFDGECPPVCEMKYEQWARSEEARLRVLPSGHILGGAMLQAETPEGSMLYAGDVRPTGSHTCPPARFAKADLLIIEDTFGAVNAPFLAPRDAARTTLELCQGFLSRGRTPVLVTMSNCGKAQDAVVSLLGAGVTPALQTKLWRFSEVYRRQGKLTGGYGRLRHGRMNRCDVAMVTASYLGYQERDLSSMVEDPAYILLSGWAAAEHDGFYDALVPWSDHGSRDDLLETVAAVEPKEVWTFAGGGDLAEDLGKRGYRARHLHELGE